MDRLSLPSKLFGLACLLGNVLSPAVADTIQIGFSHAPPWAFRLGENCVAGINKEIVEHALQNKGYDIKFKLSSYSRMVAEFSSHNLDIASPMAIDLDGAFYTDRYLPYRDVAITQVERNFSWKKIADLKGRNVVAYQKAIKILPQEFRQMIEAGEFQYKEHPDRRSQILMLSTGRFDAVIGEVRILMYQADKYYDVNKVEEQNIFPEVHYGASVWDKDLHEALQQGLAEIKANGEYDKIFKRYDRSIPEIDAMLKSEYPQCFQ